jgi:hypothetical protein
MMQASGGAAACINLLYFIFAQVLINYSIKLKV